MLVCMYGYKLLSTIVASKLASTVTRRKLVITSWEEHYLIEIEHSAGASFLLKPTTS